MTLLLYIYMCVCVCVCNSGAMFSGVHSFRGGDCDAGATTDGDVNPGAAGTTNLLSPLCVHLCASLGQGTHGV